MITVKALLYDVLRTVFSKKFRIFQNFNTLRRLLTSENSRIMMPSKTKERFKMNIERMDNFYARVVNTAHGGVFLKAENGDFEAYAHSFNNLAKGTRVLCSMRKPAEGERKMLVYIDSVDNYLIA